VKEPNKLGIAVGKSTKEAEKYCKENDLKFTPVRRKVLELLLQKNTAVGAYEILDLLREAGFKNQPPVAYRALDFLVKNGFAHKIEQLNSFIGCMHPGKDHSPAFMICRNCDFVSEEEAISPNSSVSKIASKTGFKVEKAIIEARGLCHSCASVA
jgi:Fur family zinc uptake transcriptional regulator